MTTLELRGKAQRPEPTGEGHPDRGGQIHQRTPSGSSAGASGPHPRGDPTRFSSTSAQQPMNQTFQYFAEALADHR